MEAYLSYVPAALDSAPCCNDAEWYPAADVDRRAFADQLAALGPQIADDCGIDEDAAARAAYVLLTATRTVVEPATVIGGTLGAIVVNALLVALLARSRRKDANRNETTTVVAC